MLSAQNFIIIGYEKFRVGLNIAYLRQECHKMCDFSGETFKGLEVL